MNSILYPFKITDWTHRSGMYVTQREGSCNISPPTIRSEDIPSLGKGLWGRFGGLCVPSRVPKGGVEVFLGIWSLHRALRCSVLWGGKSHWRSAFRNFPLWKENLSSCDIWCLCQVPECPEFTFALSILEPSTVEGRHLWWLCYVPRQRAVAFQRICVFFRQL